MYVHRATQRPGVVAVEFCPASHQFRRGLGVELDADSGTHAEGLVGVQRCAGELRCAGGKHGDGVVVGLGDDRGALLGEASKERVVEGALVPGDLEGPVFPACGVADGDGAPERLGEELVTEADRERGDAGVNGSHHELLERLDPLVGGLVMGAHRAAENEQAVTEGFHVGYVALPQRDGAEQHPVAGQPLTETVHRHVLVRLDDRRAYGPWHGGRLADDSDGLVTDGTTPVRGVLRPPARAREPQQG